LFENATGSTSLRVGMKVPPGSLPEVCESLLKLYESNEYKEAFPNIQNISPIKDPDRVDLLDEKLFQAFNDRSDAVVLAIPEIVDYQGDKTCCFFCAEGKTSEIFPDITIEALWGFLDENGITPGSASSFRQYQLVLCDVEGSPGRAYTVMRSLVYETTAPEDAAIFHVTDGNWYRAEAAFVERMTTYINARCSDCHLPPYNHDKTVSDKQVYSEEAYNSAITDWNEMYLCLDRTDISPAGASQVEPCDIYSISHIGIDQATADMYHIKISTRSAHLSHLFNQGVNAIELLKQEEESATKFRDILGGRVPVGEGERFFAPIDSKRYRGVFGIISHKAAGARAENLPLFSRLSLVRTMQILELYSVQCTLIFIED
jgi:uncharacterized protein (TIGR04141 family)